MAFRVPTVLLSACMVAAVTLPGDVRPEMRSVAPLSGLQSNASPSVPEALPVSGTERLKWEYDVPSPEEMQSLSFLVFVDDAPANLEGVQCNELDGPLALSCTAPLPPLSAGLHTIDVAAAVAGEVRGIRSEPILVRYQPLDDATAGRADGSNDRSLVTSDGIRLQMVERATDLIDPTDLAVLPDGRILIAERTGEVRVVDETQPLTRMPRVGEVSAGGGRGLLAIAIDAAFEKTRAVFAVYTTDGGGRLARFSLQGNALVDRVVLLDALPLSTEWPAALLRVGPDGRLFVGLDDGGQPGRAADLGTYIGKVLRLTRDGTTPSEARSPVYLSGISEPLGLTWQRASRTAWFISRDGDGVQWLQAVAAGETGEPIVRCRLPREFEFTDALLYDSPDDTALNGNLLLATASDGILRVGPHAEWLFRGALHSGRALVSGRNGVYVLTEHALLQLSPVGSDGPGVPASAAGGMSEVPDLTDFCLPLSVLAPGVRGR